MAVGRMTYEIRHSSLGGVGTNSWALRWDGAFLGGEVNAQAVADIVNSWYDNTNTLCPDTATFSFNGEISGLGPDEGSTIQVDNANKTGAQAGGVLAPALCLCTSWKAPTGGRSGRGRTFLNPLSIGMGQADGTPTDTAMTVIRNAAQSLVTANAAAGNGAVAIWSTKDSQARDITSGSVRDVFAVLRSRRD